MAKAQRRIPRLTEFSQPVVASRDASQIEKAINERLDRLCDEFGIARRYAKENIPELISLLTGFRARMLAQGWDGKVE